MDYIEIEKELIPYRFDIDLSGLYTFEVQYNAEHDFFTVGLEQGGEVIVSGERLVYGVPLFVDITDSRLPAVGILPMDLSGSADAVTYETLSESVFLYLYEGDSDA